MTVGNQCEDIERLSHTERISYTRTHLSHLQKKVKMNNYIMKISEERKRHSGNEDDEETFTASTRGIMKKAT